AGRHRQKSAPPESVEVAHGAPVKIEVARWLYNTLLRFQNLWCGLPACIGAQAGSPHHNKYIERCPILYLMLAMVIARLIFIACLSFAVACAEEPPSDEQIVAA